eukprot:gb/GEZN01012711.1/.p1 GENE.gb/GEZN01012711.1/~~gb/GEZN01012711.1/.p1  ORF type:complete len:271 (+),score=34.83 gb/GEZN01012711.1/:36-815(+)
MFQRSALARLFRPQQQPTLTQVRFMQRSRPVRSAGIVQHRDSPINNEETPFAWTPESLNQIKWILSKYPANYKQSAVMPLLVLAQEQGDNWLPLSAMNKVAETLDLPPIRVYEVATFYSMYNREPVGKYHIQLCGTTPCQLCGAESIKETILKHLDVHEGETTPDGLFHVTEVECLGACANAPMIQINNHEFYENLTPETTVKLLDNLKNGKPVQVGPQNGQNTCEGISGRTTLKDISKLVSPCRDFDTLKQELASKKK